MSAGEVAPPHLLVADDEQQTLELLELSLQLSGFQVTTVGSGMAALACAQRQRFDLILLGAQMSPWDGLETARQLRTLPAAPPIVLLSAAPLDEAARALVAASLEKPFRPSQLAAVIRDTLAHRPEA
ncbi:response regulator [Deinococcus irradiatisoli]|uniref:response regulator n=1 Tax=Deinococcus irradiatisoli TaxID=2202254 RepID=UPI001FEC64C7|nr:response regulator [Deinococcus irradiatisoli]